MLRTLRQEQGQTLRSLARLAGISHARLGELEADAEPIRETTALKLAVALGVSIAAITTAHRHLDPPEAVAISGGRT
jgi:transcriptional regulator with XRE-family HTH domain